MKFLTGMIPVLTLLLLPAGVSASNGSENVPPHPIEPEDRLEIPGDPYRFDGYEGKACPYHLQKSFNVLVDDIIPVGREGDKDLYELDVYIKNYSPCLFANFYLNVRMTDLEGDVVDERKILVNYVPSYSSNIVKDNLWLPIYVDPHELKFEFRFEQIR